MNSVIQYAQAFIGTTNTYMHALLVVVAALFVALVILPLVDGLLLLLTRKTKTDVDDHVRAALRRPLFRTILLSGAVLAVPFLALPAGFATALIAIVYSLIIVVVSKGISDIVVIMLRGAAQGKQIQAINTQTFPLFKNMMSALVLAGAFYALFLVWGIDVTAWIASAGILGIAVGFAAKDTLSNLISGVFILADKPYSVGDFVVLQSGITGIVSNVGLRSTRIRTFDDEEVTIPNGTIANQALTNKTTGPDTGRVKLVIGVAYGTDPRMVERSLLELVQEHEAVLAEPAPSVQLIAFGESSLDFQLSCRVKNSLDVFGTKSDLRFSIVERFAKEHIEIPFPQRDVHMV